MWSNLLLASLLLICVVGLWFGVYALLNPRLRNPDGESRVTGTCGDTMEIRLRFNGNRVTEATHWTSGCLFSMNCIAAAGNLAIGKTAGECLDLDSDTIQKSIGGLPRDHMHCATLAVATLREAVNDHMKKAAGRKTTPLHPSFSDRKG